VGAHPRPHPRPRQPGPEQGLTRRGLVASWQESEIIENLFVGDLQDAQRFDGMIINVLPDLLEGEPAHAIHMPFLAKGLETLERTADLIDDGLARGHRVLVHCEEGCERAPLVIAWFLKTRRAMTLDQAYALLKSRRPIVEDRRRWLGIYNR
jgi:protein-tyrosine phosphatase